MLCAACRAPLAETLAHCPLCQTPARTDEPTRTYRRIAMTHSALQEETHANEHADAADSRLSAPAASTLIEFPTPGRAPKPQWRKDLSERVREIQQRKAQEAAREAEATTQSAQGIVLPPVDDT